MKKIFLLLTAMILCTGLWAESVTFTTYKYYAPVSSDWVNNQMNTERNNLKNDYAVQSNPYVKIDTKNPNATYDWGNLPIDGAGNIQPVYNYYLWLQTDKVEVSLLDAYAEIESITVTYTTTTEQTEVGVVIVSSTFTMPFPAGQTSHLFSFTQGSIRVMSITVNYHSTIVDNVPYIDADGNAQTANNVTKITNTSSTLDAGWYVVNGEVSTAGLVCNGEVHLILADGATLMARGENGHAGIRVSGAGNALTIYGQANQTGKLIAKGENSAAGIGGREGETGSNITINGGDVTANGGFNAAGIGGGKSGSASNITINGGKINATGVKSGAAGIGGGQSGSASNITINGGEVTATGALYAAGIGGGQSGSASNIRISGGTVIARGGTNNNGDEFYSAIGAGANGTANGIYVSTSCVLKADNNNPPTTVISHTTTQDIAALLAGKQYATIVPIAPMTVTLDRQGGEGGTASVTANYDAAMPEITLPTRTGYAFQGYFSEAEGAGTQYYNADGTSAHVCDFTEAKTLYAYWERDTRVSYVDMVVTTDAEGHVTVTPVEMMATDVAEITNTSTTLTTGWYAVNGEVQTSGLVCEGAVHIILADGAKLTATGGDGTPGVDQRNPGIKVSGNGNSLTIYGQTNQNGELVAKGGHTAAGIGGGENEEGTDITINGGMVTANGGYHGAGIGGGYRGTGSNITIHGGDITATGGVNASAIGGGYVASASNITINGGVITANGGNYASAIGGGSYGVGEYITINAGDITATGGEYAAGIGGGYKGDASNITIKGGKVVAHGGEDAACIGAGEDGSASNIFVNTALVLKADNTNPPTTAIAHTSTEDVAAALADKQYATIEPITPPSTVTVTTHYAADKGANYSTYYNGMHAYEVVTDGVTLYTASLETANGETVLSLHEIEGNILPAATAVVVRSETETNVVLTLYVGSTEEVVLPANNLCGVDVETPTSELSAGSLYILSAQVLSGDAAATTAFYRYMGDTMPANKAYLPLAPDAPAPTRIVWSTEQTNVPTSLENTNANDNANANANDNANKVLRDGVLYIIKHGHVYTAQGMLVE